MSQHHVNRSDNSKVQEKRSERTGKTCIEEDGLPIVVVNDEYPEDDHMSGGISQKVIDRHMTYLADLEHEGKNIPNECYECFKKLKNPQPFEPLSSSPVLGDDYNNQQGKRNFTSFFDLSYYKECMESVSASSRDQYADDKNVETCSNASNCDNESDVSNNSLCEEHKHFLQKTKETLKSIKCAKGCNICCHIKNKKYKNKNDELNRGLFQKSENTCEKQNFVKRGLENIWLYKDNCAGTSTHSYFGKNKKYSSHQPNNEEISNDNYCNSQMINPDKKSEESIKRKDIEVCSSAQNQTSPNKNGIDSFRGCSQQDSPMCCIADDKKSSEQGAVKNINFNKNTDEKKNSQHSLNKELNDQSKNICPTCRSILIENKNNDIQLINRSLMSHMMTCNNEKFKDLFESVKNKHKDQCVCIEVLALDYLEKTKKELQELKERLSNCANEITEPKQFMPASASAENEHFFSQKKSKELMAVNEQIMANRERVWGNNIPPDFIIKDTDYAKRHVDCCTNNLIAAGNLPYRCPKSISTENRCDKYKINSTSDDSTKCNLKEINKRINSNTSEWDKINKEDEKTNLCSRQKFGRDTNKFSDKSQSSNIGSWKCIEQKSTLNSDKTEQKDDNKIYPLVKTSVNTDACRYYMTCNETKEKLHLNKDYTLPPGSENLQRDDHHNQTIQQPKQQVSSSVFDKLKERLQNYFDNNSVEVTSNECKSENIKKNTDDEYDKGNKENESSDSDDCNEDEDDDSNNSVDHTCCNNCCNNHSN